MYRLRKIIWLIPLFLFAAVLVYGSLRKAPAPEESRENHKISAESYNIILIALTNIGTDHMSLYGYHRDTTPNINAFAREGMVFQNFFSPASWTLPAGMSLFTSLYPFSHQVINRVYPGAELSRDALSPAVVTLIDILKNNGYFTTAFTGGFDYRGRFGLIERFDNASQSQKPSELLQGAIDARLLEERRFGSIAVSLMKAREWLNKLPESKKFFMFVQGYDTHCPFNPQGEFDRYFVDFDTSDITVDPFHCYRGFDDGDPVVAFNSLPNDSTSSSAPALKKEYSGRVLSLKEMDFLEAQYDAEIRYVDHVLGYFLQFLKDRQMLEKTIVILLSEHGELFAKHGRFGRAGTIRGTHYDEVIHVPLIIRHPALPSGQTSELTQIIDVMPTVLDFLKIPIPASAQGKSLLPLIQEGRPVQQEVYGGSIYGQTRDKITNRKSVNEFIRTKEYKLIHEELYDAKGKVEDVYELYHVASDKYEETNLIQSREEVAGMLREKLNLWAAPWDNFKKELLQKMWDSEAARPDAAQQAVE
jgi:arylsulfatase A-like enzyme